MVGRVEQVEADLAVYLTALLNKQERFSHYLLLTSNGIFEGGNLYCIHVFYITRHAIHFFPMA